MFDENDNRIAPEPQKCGLCTRKRDRLNYKTLEWRKTCSAHRKPGKGVAELENVLEDVKAELRAAVVGKKMKITVKRTLGLKDNAKSCTEAGVIEEFSDFANDIRKKVEALTKWRFPTDHVECTATGPSFRYRCSQDAKGARERNGKKHDDARKKRSRKMTRFDCGGSLSINIDTSNGTANFILHHSYRHPPYTWKQISEKAQACIRKWYRLGLRRPSHIYRALARERDRKGKGKKISQKQVQYWLNETRTESWRKEVQMTELEELFEMSRHLQHLRRVELDPAPSWEAEAWLNPAFEKQAKAAKEILFDGTHGLTHSGWELVVGFAEDRGASYPIGFLALRASANRGKTNGAAKAAKNARVDLTQNFFQLLRDDLEVNPELVHVDKDFSEISAAKKIWTAAKIQTCLWHMKKAVDRRLCKQANRQRTRYSVKEVQQVVPSADPKFQPTNPVLPTRFIPLDNPPPVPSSTLRAETAPGTNPLRLVFTLPESYYLNNPQAPQYSPEVLAMMKRLEYEDEDDENDWIDGEGEMEGGNEGENVAMEIENRGVDGDEGPGNLTKKQKRAKLAREKKGAGKAIADAQQRTKIVSLMETHYSRHPLIPNSSGKKETADEIYRSSAKEMYEYCLKEGKGDAWAYLWESWYRPGRWDLWARSAFHLIGVYRTTMGAEAFFKVLKNDTLGKARGSLVSIIHRIDQDVITEKLQKLQALDEGERNLDFRLARSRWRDDLWAEHRKIYKKEWERRELAGSARAPIDFLRFPPLEDENRFRRTDDDLDWLDPSLRPPCRPREWQTSTKWTVCPIDGTCSCPSFLRSRFLLCKHTALATPPSVLGDGSKEDEHLFFDVVERHRTVPFWRVPEIAKIRAKAKKVGIPLPTDDSGSVQFHLQRLLDEVTRGGGDGEYEGDFGGDFGGGDEGSQDDTDFNGGWHYELNSGSSDTEVQETNGIEAASSQKRARSSESDSESSDDDDDDGGPDLLSQEFDSLVRSLAEVQNLTQKKVDLGVDHRHVREVRVTVEKMVKAMRSSEKVVGSGGQAERRGKNSGGSRKKRKSRGVLVELQPQFG